MVQADRAADERPFSVDVDRIDGKVIVSPRGDLDMATAERLGNELESLIQPGECIVVDCQQLSFLDSTGITVLIRAHISCKQHGATLEMQSVPPGPQRALELGGLAELFGLDHAFSHRVSHGEAEQR